jgi:hypothetical protein
MKTFQSGFAILTALILFGCADSGVDQKESEGNDKLVIRYESMVIWTWASSMIFARSN